MREVLSHATKRCWIESNHKMPCTSEECSIYLVLKVIAPSGNESHDDNIISIDLDLVSSEAPVIILSCETLPTLIMMAYYSSAWKWRITTSVKTVPRPILEIACTG